MKASLAPSRLEFVREIKKFVAGEPRDAMYSVAERLLKTDWGNPDLMADDIGVLLLTWNQAFYRYGEFDFDRLRKTLKRHLGELTVLRLRSISTLSKSDERQVRSLFEDFLQALRIYEGKAKDRKTPVGTAKALHLLAPDFFPLWDQYIAAAYGCRYASDPARSYIRFCTLMQGLVRHASQFRPPLPLAFRRNLLKRTDEYNYAMFTM